VSPELDWSALLDLVGSVYDVALSSEGWDPLLARLSQQLGGNGALFYVQDREATVQFVRLWNLPPRAFEEYESRFAALDVALDEFWRSPLGTIKTDESLPADVRRASEFFQEFRRPWDVERYVAGDVFRDARRVGMLAVQGSRSRVPFGESERMVMERLLPHVRRAVQMRAHLEQVLGQTRALEDAVDGLAAGVVLIDERGAVLHANSAARGICARNDGLAITGGRLVAASGAAQRALAKAIGEAIETTKRAGLAGGAALPVPRSSGARPYAVLVNPGPGSESESMYRAASAVVLIGDPDARLEAPEQAAARLYGLTPSEARLAVAVASGDSLETYALAREIAVSTARFQMKQVLAKTGARRQADLVRLLLTGPLGLLKSQGRGGDRGGR
jgi:DNA-binding CsgD family transcriptional regulator